jgi:hypothetical protein
VLALILTCVVVFPVSGLVFFALTRMDRLKSLKISVKLLPLPTLSFEADAGDEVKELPPSDGS